VASSNFNFINFLFVRPLKRRANLLDSTFHRIALRLIYLCYPFAKSSNPISYAQRFIVSTDCKFLQVLHAARPFDQQRECIFNEVTEVDEIIIHLQVANGGQYYKTIYCSNYATSGVFLYDFE
jgi:hypothetical protein